MFNRYFSMIQLHTSYKRPSFDIEIKNKKSVRMCSQSIAYSRKSNNLISPWPNSSIIFMSRRHSRPFHRQTQINMIILGGVLQLVFRLKFHIQQNVKNEWYIHRYIKISQRWKGWNGMIPTFLGYGLASRSGRITQIMPAWSRRTAAFLASVRAMFVNLVLPMRLGFIKPGAPQE